MVRKSSSSNRDRQERSQPPEAEDITFSKYCSVLVRRNFPHARSSLTKLLTDAIVIRRRRLLRHHSHEGNLQRPGAAGRTSTSSRIDIGSSSQDANSISETIDLPTSSRLSPPTTISRPGPSIMNRLRSGVERAGSIIGRLTSSIEEVRYPSQPERGAGNAGLVICPYCFEPLTIPMSDDEWRSFYYTILTTDYSTNWLVEITSTKIYKFMFVFQKTVQET
jgi:hypothetical protein